MGDQIADQPTKEFFMARITRRSSESIGLLLLILTCACFTTPSVAASSDPRRVRVGQTENWNYEVTFDVDWKDVGELGKEIWKYMKRAGRAVKGASNTMFGDHSVRREVKYVTYEGRKYPVAIIPITANRDGSGKRITGNLALAGVFGKGEIPYRVFYSASADRVKDLKVVMLNDEDWSSDTAWRSSGEKKARIVQHGDVIPSWGGARERYLTSRGGNWKVGDAVIVVRADMPMAAFKQIGKLKGISMKVSSEK